MSETFVATATTTIDASPEAVWEALTTPETIEQYFFGATVVTDWEVGSPIVFEGEWEGEPYEDKGEILRFEPGEALAYSHWSPLSGVPDAPENYHAVAFDLTPAGGGTELAVTQDNNDSEDARDHAEGNWQLMLGNLKELLEG